ncbi:multiple PDZ domain protein-like [Amphiura filiformis]|uniref:multiple PDZ domain protein-like n=1 Tax=Amphiura filiformis TaxID=82378 RepID=UPI003B215D92
MDLPKFDRKERPDSGIGTLEKDATTPLSQSPPSTKPVLPPKPSSPASNQEEAPPTLRLKTPREKAQTLLMLHHLSPSKLPPPLPTSIPPKMEQSKAVAVSDVSPVQSDEDEDDAPPALPSIPPPQLSLSPITETAADVSLSAEDPEEGVIEIRINKNQGEDVGIDIIGGSDTSRSCVYVKGIRTQSAAEREGRLRSGDQLLDINGTCMVGITNKEAMDILHNYSTNNNNIALVVARKKMEEDEEVEYTDSESEDLVEDLATELARAESADTLNRSLSEFGDDFSLKSELTDGDSNVFDDTDGMFPSTSSPKTKGANGLSENNNSNKLSVPAEVVRRTNLNARARRGYRDGKDVKPRGLLERKWSESSSSTVLLSTTELEKLIDDANESLEDGEDTDISVVILHKEEGQGLGLTVAGGIDQEVKEISVHRVIPGGLADRDGRVQRGDRVLSVNGKVLKDATHAQALSYLKDDRPDVVLVVSRPLELEEDEEADDNTIDIEMAKGAAGLGFSVEGGKSSPKGDVPITVKKIFMGGVADRSGLLHVGDEIVEVNNKRITHVSHFEAWTYLKSVPIGIVKMKIRPVKRPSED